MILLHICTEFWWPYFECWWSSYNVSVALIDPNSIQKTNKKLFAYRLSDRPDKRWIQTFYKSVSWCSYFSIVLISLLPLNDRKMLLFNWLVTRVTGDYITASVKTLMAYRFQQIAAGYCHLYRSLCVFVYEFSFWCYVLVYLFFWVGKIL